MSMPKKFGPQVRTRLLQSDAERFRTLARARYLSESALAREAILRYLDEVEQLEQRETEGVYANQVRRSTDRICGFLARMAADLRAVYCYVGQEEPQRIEQWRSSAFRQITQRLTKDESEIAQQLAKNVSAQQKEETH